MSDKKEISVIRFDERKYILYDALGPLSYPAVAIDLDEGRLECYGNKQNIQRYVDKLKQNGTGRMLMIDFSKTKFVIGVKQQYRIINALIDEKEKEPSERKLTNRIIRAWNSGREKFNCFVFTELKDF